MELGPSFVGGSRLRAALFIAAIILAQLLGPSARIAVYGFFGVWALLGPLGGVQALTLTWLTTYLNPALFPTTDLELALRWFPIVSAACSASAEFFLRRDDRLASPIVAIFAFAAFGAAVSLLRSYMVDISILRLGAFTVGAATVLLSFQLTSTCRELHEKWFVGFFAVVVLGGLPLIGHELGYVVNGRGFQGLLSHPQSYGVFLAPFVAWITLRLAVSSNANVGFRAASSLFLFVAGWVSLIATESRTGLVGALGGIMLAGLLVLPRSPLLRLRLRRSPLTPLLIATTWLLAAAFVLKPSEMQNAVRDFATKGQPELSVVESVKLSRGALVEASWDNFRKSPLLGSGFGLASNAGQLQPRRLSGVPVPVSAPVEKGFLPTTVLEEVGLLGGIVFLVLVFLLARPVLESANLDAAALVASALLVNFGEMVFFALGGMGLYVWLMVGYGRISR